MNHSIKHRGPDAEGIYIDDNKLGLGHRRLSIIDISDDSNQPMHSNSNKWHIVFNGEIYNFQEIKYKLNYSFKTNSDTEVILASIELKGVEWFLEQANGMFAIGLYDSFNKELYLIRDRLGIKPLYYFIDKEKIVFSSEIKAILNSGLVNAEFNELAIDEYLANRYVRAPYTFFKNIYQVNPGTYIKLNSSFKKSEVKYWDLPEKFNNNSIYSEEEILQMFDREINKAISYRLISDVPVGTYLSGGVDSSLITAITVRNLKRKIDTYTIGFPELNEFYFAKLVAKQYNTDHHEILIKKNDYFNNWERLIAFKDAPLGVPNEIPLAVMSSKLKERITVVLSGEGADELMGGYGRIFRSPFDYKNLDLDIDFYDFFISKYEYVSREIRNKFINTPFNYRDQFDLTIREDFINRSEEENVFRFFHKFHVKGLLQRVDMTTMQTSVEARVPFLDHNLIEFTYTQVPYDLKLKWKSINATLKAKNISSDIYSEILDTPKYLLRKLSYQYIPKEIVDRKKVGFPVPLTNWFSDIENIAKEILWDADWLKKGVIDNLINRSKSEMRAGQILWMFINIEMFKRLYFNKNWTW